MENQLSNFGENFIKEVRDNSLFVLQGIIDGHMKSQEDQELHMTIKSMSSEDLDILKSIAYKMVDLSLHNTLFFFESNEKWKIVNIDGTVNLIELSDGLSGELYTEDGWIRKYSEYPPSKGL